jgi:hypothetical protein
LGLAQVVRRNDVILPTQVQFPQVTCSALNEYIIVMTLSLIVDWPCAMKILGFNLSTILEMRGSTRVPQGTILEMLEMRGSTKGFSLRFKKEKVNWI